MSVMGTTNYIPELFADPVERHVEAPSCSAFRTPKARDAASLARRTRAAPPSITIASPDPCAEVAPAWSVDFWPDAAEEVWHEFARSSRPPLERTDVGAPIPFFSQFFDPSH